MKIDELIETNKNNELKEILELVKEDSIFFGENKRLLSKSEIENYKEDLAITVDIIPLIDLADNIFIVYDNNDEKFKKCNISEEVLYGEIHSIEKYIEQIYENIFELYELKKMVDSNNCKPELIYELGRRYYEGINEEKNYELAITYFEKAANLGNSKAKLKLGICMYYGRGMEKDYERAYYSFKQLAEKYNNKKAKNFIGRMYYYGHHLECDYRKAFDIFSELANEDDKDAKFYLGEMYYFGKYVERNYEKAYYIFNELVEKYNDMDSKYFIGEMYYYGYYLNKDIDKAIEIFEFLLKEYKYKKAIRMLLYEYYWGEKCNYEKAYNIAIEFVDQDETYKTKEILVDMYFHGNYVTQDYKKAFEYAKDIENRYNVVLNFPYLAWMYYYGNGTEQNYELAFNQFKKHAEKNEWDSVSQLMLGYNYLHGDGIATDDSKAIYWFEKSALNGNRDAQYMLGKIYYYAEEVNVKVNKDTEYALQLLEKSANAGYEKAIKELEKIRKSH